ncbi:hypothetical protein [Sandarakinorhabdus sp.]|uniref:hypothetical protein n=1 Tax=Sandarakinorhabdus sp. TaxID=1916663 RepID=UPI00333F782C
MAAQINPYRQTSSQGATDTDDGPVRSSINVPGVAGFSGRGLLVTGSVGSRYEGNLTRQQPADDGVRITPQARAEYGLGSERLGLFLSGSYGRDIIRGNNILRGRNRADVSGGADFQLARCSGQTGGSFRQSLNLRNDATLFGSFQQRTTTIGLTGQCRLGSAISLNAAVNRVDSKSVGTVGRALDLATLTYSAGLAFNSNFLGRFSIDGTISQTDLPGRQVVTAGGLIDDALTQRSLRAGVQRQIGPRITLGLYGSYISSKPENDSPFIVVDSLAQFVDRSGFSGFGFDATVDMKLSNRLTLDLTAGRNVNSNGFVGALTTVSNTYAISAATRVGRYSLIVGAQSRSNRFLGGVVSEFDPVPRQSDNRQTYFARVGGRLGQRLRFDFEVNHARRKSVPTFLSFTSTGAGLTLSAVFGRGRS